MFLKLYDGHSIAMENIICIIPYESKSDIEFIRNVSKGEIKGKVFNWTHGKPMKSAIVTFIYGSYIIYITSMSADLVQKRIDEHQNVTRRHGGADFTKNDIDKSIKG